jgi:hypothetical protein
MEKIRLTSEEKDKLSRLIASGLSLNKISKTLNKNKTTIYYHYHKIKGKIIIPICVNQQNEDIIGEFMGLFAGDGCIDKTPDHKYRVYLYFNIKEKSYVDNMIESVLIPLFGKKPMIYLRDNMICLCYYSKNIHHFINEYLTWDKENKRTYSIELKHKKHDNDFIIGFLRGCLDSDGFVSKTKICFSTVSPGLKEDIVTMLSSLGIKHSTSLYIEKRGNRKPMYQMTVSREDQNLFLNTIKPRNKKRD